MAVNNTLTNAPQKEPEKMTQFLATEPVQAKMNNIFSGTRETQRFVSAITAAISTTPKLAECTNNSIFSCALTAQSMGLTISPQLGYCYAVPYGTQATFVMGYKGYIQLAMRSGQYKKIILQEIKEGELVSKDILNEEYKFSMIEEEAERESRPTIGYYMSIELLNGFKKSIYWSREKMMKHADRFSKAFSAEKYDDYIEGRVPTDKLYKYSSFWYKSFDDMAKKTLVRQMLNKWGILSLDMETAITEDINSDNLLNGSTTAPDVNSAEDTENKFFDVQDRDIEIDGDKVNE